MTHHELTVTETPAARDFLGPVPAPLRRSYVALTALFKRGRQYLPGEEIELDPETARHFLTSGEIKELK